MKIRFVYPVWGKSLLIFAVGISGILLAFQTRGVEAQEAVGTDNGTDIALTLDNASKIVPFCKMAVSKASFPENNKGCAKDEDVSKQKTQKIGAVLTAYSSTVEETDSTPFLTANGTYVHDGVVANNMLPFGTKFKIPAIYGDKIFSVEDRMNLRVENHHFDIWFPSHSEAEQFGVKYAYIEVLN